MGAIGGDAQRELLGRVQSVMGVIEGHAEHVMDVVGAQALPSLAELRSALDRRRRERPPLLALLERLIGLDAKMRQYEDGKRFCDAVARAGGPPRCTASSTGPSCCRASTSCTTRMRGCVAPASTRSPPDLDARATSKARAALGFMSRNLRGARGVGTRVRPIPVAVAALALLAVALPGAAHGSAAQRRAHLTHGTVRKLCEPARVRKWPQGPSVGRVASGKDLRRYHFEGAWALGVTTKRPFLRGWVLVGRVLPAVGPRSARGAGGARAGGASAGRATGNAARQGAAAARLRAAHLPARPAAEPRDRAAVRRRHDERDAARPQPVARRDGQRPRQAARLDPARRALPRPRQARGRAHARRRAPRVTPCLAPPAVVPCGALVSGRRMIEVGLLGTGDVGAELHDRAGRLVSSARFTHGRAGRWRYAAAGPYHCGQRYTVVYEAGGVQTRLAIRVAARPKARRAPSQRRRPRVRRGVPEARAARHRVVGSRARRRGLRRPRSPTAEPYDGRQDDRRTRRGRAARRGPRRSSPTAATGRSTTASTRDRRSRRTGATSRSTCRRRGSSPATATACATSSSATPRGGRAELVSVARGGGVGNAHEPRGVDQRRRSPRRVRVLGIRPRRRRSRRRARRLRARPAQRHDAAHRARPQPRAQRRRALRRVRGRGRRGRRGPRRGHAAARRRGRLPPRAERRRALRRVRVAPRALQARRQPQLGRLPAGPPDGRDRAAQRGPRRPGAQRAEPVGRAQRRRLDRRVSVRRAADARRPHGAARRLRPRRRQAPHDARQRQSLRAARQRLQPLPVDQRRRAARRVRLARDRHRAGRAARARPGLPA